MIRRQGTVSKQDLKEQSTLTVSTLTRVLEELVELGLILEVGYGESTGGRRPILYRINPTYAYVFGLDISRTYSKLVLCDLDLRKKDEKRWKMSDRMTPEMLIEEVLSAARNMLDRHQISILSILGMGVGAVGPLDRSRGLILDPRFFPAPGWNQVQIRALLEAKLDIPVFLDNGVNTAILGEYWKDSVNRYQHLLYIHAGVGLRLSMISEGKIVHGAVDVEGSAGQMIIQADGLPHRDPDGNYGSWESYASLYAMEQRARSLLKQGRESLLSSMVNNGDEVTYAMLVQALKEKDALALEIVTQAATYFGIGLANLLNILHPEKVILGGPLHTDDELFFQVATRVAIQKTYQYPSYQVVFANSSLGEDGVAIGASVMVTNQLAE
ncbi:ROK family protein [Ferviditalea candida]|uniref:ROK family protein n=1 Tax=Ferviditalea candida TaxID=3108399 RepID=A0ABU5ZH01_9BACL|nr:ROK family protein [Paenibacillaceae bacterium T2]